LQGGLISGLRAMGEEGELRGGDKAVYKGGILTKRQERVVPLKKGRGSEKPKERGKPAGTEG